MSQTFAGMLEKVKAGSGSIAKEAPRMISFVAQLDDTPTLKECKAQVAAITEYLAHRRDSNVEEYNAAMKVKARVEHRLGELLAKTVNHKGGRPKQGHNDSIIPRDLSETKFEKLIREQQRPLPEGVRIERGSHLRIS